MAINFSTALIVVSKITDKISAMEALLRQGENGSIDGMALGKIIMTAEHKTTLRSQYSTLKAEVETLWAQLP